MAEIVRRDGNSLQISGAMVARMFLTEYLGNSSAERPLCEPAQLALDTLEQMPPQGPISWDYDRIALKAAALLLQDVPDSDPRRRQIENRLLDARSRLARCPAPL